MGHEMCEACAEMQGDDDDDDDDGTYEHLRKVIKTYETLTNTYENLRNYL